MRIRTLGDAYRWLRVMLDAPRIFAAGVEAERKRMAVWAECRNLGLDVGDYESIESLTEKRDAAAKESGDGRRPDFPGVDHFKDKMSPCFDAAFAADYTMETFLRATKVVCPKCKLVLKNRNGRRWVYEK